MPNSEKTKLFLKTRDRYEFEIKVTNVSETLPTGSKPIGSIDVLGDESKQLIARLRSPGFSQVMKRLIYHRKINDGTDVVPNKFVGQWLLLIDPTNLET